MITNSTSSNITVDCLLSRDFGRYNITSLPDSVLPTWISLAVINGIAAPPTVVINLLVIWTVLEDENLRSVSYNLLLAALALTDLLVGLFVQPFFATVYGCQVKECSSLCQFTSYALVVMVCVVLTLCTLMMASVERYLAIEFPIFYTTKVTSKKTIIATSIVWLFMPTVVLAGRLLSDKYDAVRKISSLSIVSANALVILFCTAKVQFTAYRQRKPIAEQQAAVQQEQQQEQQQNRRQEYKRSFTMAMLVIASILFYCPFIVTVIIEAVKGKEVTDDFQYISQPITVTLINLQSLVNPLIMSLRLSYIRQGVKKKLFCCKGHLTTARIDDVQMTVIKPF